MWRQKTNWLFNCIFASLLYETIPLSKKSELPEILVRVWAIKPPVHDSAVATEYFFCLNKVEISLTIFLLINVIPTLVNYFMGMDYHLKNFYMIIWKVK